MVMTFKELYFEEETYLRKALDDFGEPALAGNPIRNFLFNQSPVMRLWFLVMLVNFVLVLCLI
jgi:hypothetical protein